MFWSVTGKQVYQPGNGGVDTFSARNSPATKWGSARWETNKQIYIYEKNIKKKLYLPDNGGVDTLHQEPSKSKEVATKKPTKKFIKKNYWPGNSGVDTQSF